MLKLSSPRTKRCTLYPKPSLPFGQRGQSTAYLIIIIVIIIFAVVITGGGGSLFSGNDPSSVLDSPTPSAGPSPTGGAAPTPTSSASNATSLTHTFLGCGTNGIPGVSIEAFASDRGYVVVDIQNATGGYDYYVGSEFIPPGRKYGVALVNGRGFNTKPWRVRLFSGGSLQDNQWQGGVEKLVDNGEATHCQ